MKALCSMILSVTAAIALGDEQVESVKMIVIADEISVHTQADERSETLCSYKKGDVVYTTEHYYRPEIYKQDDREYWVHVKTPNGDGWMQKRYLICDYIWEKLGRIKKDKLADEGNLAKGLEDSENRLDTSEVSVSPDKCYVLVSIYCHDCNLTFVPLLRVNEGLVALIDAYSWIGSLWSDDSRWLAGIPEVSIDGYFDVPLSLYDTETQTTTYIDRCQNIEKVEFFGGYLIWLGFEDLVDDEMTWDLILYNFEYERYVHNEGCKGIYPVLWAYDLSTTRRCKLLDSFKLTIGFDKYGHRQALMKPADSCPAELKESKLYKEYVGNKALIWYYKME